MKYLYLMEVVSQIISITLIIDIVLVHSVSKYGSNNHNIDLLDEGHSTVTYLLLMNNMTEILLEAGTALFSGAHGVVRDIKLFIT